MQQAETLLLSTKFNKPALVSNLVLRSKLIDRLNASHQLPFILISAPAGYGKSTLLSSYLKDVNWPSAWLSLDENDNNISRFYHYFISAIQSMFPDACRKTSGALASVNLPSYEVLAELIADDINLIDQDFFLVLDDYFYIHDIEIHNLLSKILRHPPRSMHLMIATRRDPPLPLVNLRAKQQMAEIRAQDLRFSLSEAAILIRGLLGNEVDDKTIAAMEEKTEGWVTGLYLVAMSFHQIDSQQTDSNLQEYNGSINEYLLSEVYSHIPAAIQDFLLRLSILDRFCASLCDDLSWEDSPHDPLVSGSQYLDWLIKENLFLIPLDLDKENQWYQFHRLFRLFLQRQTILRYSSEETAKLHSRASLWFSQNQLFEESLKHALAARDIKVGIQLVVKFNQKIRLPEKWQELDHLVHSFPDQVIESSPDLLLAEACVMYARFQFGRMPQILDKVEALLNDIEIEQSGKNRLQSELAALRSYLYFWAGDYQSALLNGREALDKLPEDWSYIRELTKIQMSEAMQMLGKESSYSHLIDHWSKLYINLSTSSSNRLNEQLSVCFVHWMNADFQSLKSVSENILVICRENNLDSYASIGHYFLGVVYYYQNNLTQAEQHFLSIFEQRQSINTLFMIQCACGLVLVYLALGKINRAYEIINMANSHLLETNNTSLVPTIQGFEVELAISQNDLATANRWAADFNSKLLPPMLTFYYPHFTLLKVLLTQDKEESRKEALSLLDRLQYCAESSHNILYLIRILEFEALFHKFSGDELSALAILKKALNLARPGGIVRPFIDIGPGMANLLRHLDKDDTFVQQIYNIFADEFPTTTRANSKLVVPLTDRELKVMELLEKRLTNKEIADHLVISPGTVKSHTIRIYQKLNVRSRHQAVEKALTLGIITDNR